MLRRKIKTNSFYLPCKQGDDRKGMGKKKKPKLVQAGVKELSVAILYFGARQYSAKLKMKDVHSDCIDHPKCFQGNAT